MDNQEIKVNLAPVWSRFVAFVIDGFIKYCIFFAFSFFFNGFIFYAIPTIFLSGNIFNAIAFGFLISMVEYYSIRFFYDYLLLVYNGRTLGQLIQHIREINENDFRQLSKQEVLYRSLMKVVPFEWVPIFFSSRKQALHNSVSRGIVIDEVKLS